MRKERRQYQHGLAIDPGLRAGCATFMFGSDGSQSLGAATTHRIKGGMSGVINWTNFLDQLSLWKLSGLYHQPIDFVAIEQPSGMRRAGVTPGQTESGRSKQYLFVGIYTALIYQQFPDARIVHVPAQTAKAALCGRANASKKQIQNMAMHFLGGWEVITAEMKDWEKETIADCYAIACGALRMLRREELKELT